MKTNRAQTRTTLLVLAGLLVLSTLTSANESGYTLSRWTVDGGGGTTRGSGYILRGTIGQPDAGVLESGGYTLSGGFWVGGARPVEYSIHLPLVLRNHP